MFYVPGWKREIVIRAIQDPCKASRMSDVYYYSPENTKLVCDSFIADPSCVVSITVLPHDTMLAWY